MCLLGLWNVAYPDIGVITVHDVPPEAEPGHGQTRKNNEEGGQSKVPVKKIGSWKENEVSGFVVFSQ